MGRRIDGHGIDGIDGDSGERALPSEGLVHDRHWAAELRSAIACADAFLGLLLLVDAAAGTFSPARVTLWSGLALLLFLVAVFIPEYVVGRWWENLLHNQSALWLKSRLLFTPGVMVTSVPWQLTSSARADRPAGRAPGSVRRGEPPNSAERPDSPLGYRRP